MDDDMIRRAGEVLKELRDMALTDSAFFNIENQESGDGTGSYTKLTLGTDKKFARVTIGRGSMEHFR